MHPRNGAPPRMQRALLLRDGTAVARFSRSEHETHVLVLEPNGHSYTCVGPTGAPTRHLTTTARTAHLAMLCALLQMRNRFSSCTQRDTTSGAKTLAPYVHQSLHQRQYHYQYQYPPQQQQRQADDAARYMPTFPSGESRPWRVLYRRRGMCRVARWPLGEYQVRGLWNNGAKRWEIESIEGNARVQLHGSGKLVRVAYLVEMKQMGSLADEGRDDGEDHGHTRQRMVPHAIVEEEFPMVATPSWAAFPVAVLLTASRVRHDRDSFSVEDVRVHVEMSTVPMASSELPRNGAFQAQPSFRPLVAMKEEQDGDDNKRKGNQGDVESTPLAIDTLTRLVKLPTQRLLQMAAVDCLDGLVFLVTQDSAPSILVVSDDDKVGAIGIGDGQRQGVDHDGGHAVLECSSGLFFDLYDSEGAITERFTAESAPLRLSLLARDAHETQELITQTTELLLAAERRQSLSPSTTHHKTQLSHAEDETASSSSSSFSSSSSSSSSSCPHLIRQVESTETAAGRFRAFSDGRVRVLFTDRTILQVTEARGDSTGVSHCAFTNRNGSRAECTPASASPAQWPYVDAALRFAEWAFASRQERMQRHVAQQRQQSRIERELQRIAVRCELNHGEAASFHRGAVEAGAIAVGDGDAGDGVALSLAAVHQLQQHTQEHLRHVSAMLVEHGSQADA